MADQIDEHQPREKDEVSKSEDIQTDEERKLVKKIERMFDGAKRHKEKYDVKWIDYYRLFRGKQWSERRPTYRHSEVINLIFQTIQSNVPLQTEARPRIEFLPQNPEDREFSDILNDLIESDWDKYDWSSQLLEIIYDANIFGSGLGGLRYNPDGEYGGGCLEFRSTDPFWIYPDQSARDINSDCDFLIYAEPTPTERVKMKYPEQKEFIKSDIIDHIQASKTDLERVRWASPGDRSLHREGEASQGTVDQEKVMVFEAWLKPQDITEEIEDKPNGSSANDADVSLSFVQKKKYPQGRKVVVINHRIMEDGQNPYDHGEYPFAKYDLYKLPREFWGIGECEQLESPQRMHNKIFSFALDVMTLMGNPIWVVDNASGVEVRKLTSQPGLVVTKNPNTEVRREPGVELQPYIFQLVERIKNYVDGISGSSEVNRGERPEGIVAASAIEDLMDSGKTRIKQKMRNLDAFLRNVGKQYVMNVLQFYTAPRVFRLTNKDGANKYFKFHIENRTDENNKPIKVAMVRHYEENMLGQLTPSQIHEMRIIGNFDVKVNTGSALPFNKADKEQKLLDLFDRGIIDAEEVLKQSDYPNYQAVLDRQRRIAEQQAQAQGQNPKAKH